MKKRLVVLIAILMAAGITYAQYNFTEVDNWLNAHTSEMGGRAILIVYKDGKIVYSNNVNTMSRKQKMLVRYASEKMGKKDDYGDYTTTTRQPIASCSKWLSAALVMTFVDEGKLNLNDTIGKFLPGFSKHGKGGITISDCLSHTTGILSPDLKEDLKEMKSLISMDQAISRIANFPMEGEPGKVFRYSNTGLQIAGAIIEKISGKSFETLFEERLAKPLEMKATDYGRGKVPLPAGSASSTPNDYINFLIMILNKGTFHGKVVLSEESVALMQVNRINSGIKVTYSPAEAGDAGYGYGEWVMNNGSVSSPGMFGSYPWVDNKNNYCAFLMTLYLKPDEREERYKELKRIVDQAVNNTNKNK